MNGKKFFGVLFVILNLSWAIYDIRFNNIGQWDVALSNFGNFGQTSPPNVGGFWPRGTDHNYIFGAGIWIGAIAPNGDTLVTVGYGPYGGESEPTPGPPYANPQDPQWRVYFSTKLDYPFNPLSAEDGYAIYNDFDPNSHIPNDTRPIGITIIQKTYTFPKGWADDMLFFKYIIRNDTNHTINNLYAGIGMDYDIGNEAGFGNDRGGIDLPRKLFYGWQDQSEPGWDSRGMIGWKLLSLYPLSCFKRLTFSWNPYYDWERYMVMAGYDFQNGNYEPFDTIWFPPDDQRILMSTGTWNLAPGDSIILDWALIASHDPIPPSPDMEYKADKVQAMFDTGFHSVHIVQPNGGEVVSGSYPVIYTANPITQNPLLMDFYLISEHGFDTIAFNQPNTGNYNWNTTQFPDGVMYRLIGLASDTITFGCDISDGVFTINNLGNAPPYLDIIAPDNNDTLIRDVDITWFARDPEFGDSLLLNIYFKSQYDTIFLLIASNEPNDSHFIWNTLPYRNGSGLLVVEVHDETFTVAETISVCLLNQISGGTINPIGGLNNIVNLSVLIHQPEHLTGHTYKLEFLNYKRIPDGTFMNFPEYIYKITDLNTGMVVLDTYSLRNAYFALPSGSGFNDFSPVVDGFSIRAYTDSANMVSQQRFHNDSVEVVLGNYPEDSIILRGSHFYIWWAYRGSRLQLDWALKSGGGLTIIVTDLDYGDTIPYKPYSIFSNVDSAFGWCFRPSLTPAGTPSDTLRPGYDKYIYICGDRIQMAGVGVFPQIGDRWIVYPSQYSPPIKGNVYQFTPVNYIAEMKPQSHGVDFQIFPNPSRSNVTIMYTLNEKTEIALVVYDVLGRKVKRIKEGIEKPGVHKIIWNGLDDKGRKVANGIYFVKLETDRFKRTNKIIFIRK